MWKKYVPPRDENKYSNEKWEFIYVSFDLYELWQFWWFKERKYFKTKSMNYYQLKDLLIDRFAFNRTLTEQLIWERMIWDTSRFEEIV